MPITVPAGVEVTVAEGNLVTVKGPKGTLTNDDLIGRGNLNGDALHLGDGDGMGVAQVHHQVLPAPRAP